METLKNAILVFMAKQQQESTLEESKKRGDFLIKTTETRSLGATTDEATRSKGCDTSLFYNPLALWTSQRTMATAAMSDSSGCSHGSIPNPAVSAGQRYTRPIRLRKTKSMELPQRKSVDRRRQFKRELESRKLVRSASVEIFDGPTNAPIVSSPYAQFVYAGDSDDEMEDERETELWAGCQNIN